MRVGDAPPPPGAWPLLAAELTRSKGAGLHLFTNSKKPVMHLQGKDSFQAQLESTLHQQQVRGSTSLRT